MFTERLRYLTPSPCHSKLNLPYYPTGHECVCVRACMLPFCSSLYLRPNSERWPCAGLSGCKLVAGISGRLTMVAPLDSRTVGLLGPLKFRRLDPDPPD